LDLESGFLISSKSFSFQLRKESWNSFNNHPRNHQGFADIPLLAEWQPVCLARAASKLLIWMSTFSSHPPSVSTARGQPGDVPLHSSVVDVLSEQLVLGEVNLQNDGLLCHSCQILLCGFFSLAWLTAETAGHLRGGWDSLLQEDL
jgi:hypothetical protein